MELHAHLSSDVAAFDFDRSDLASIEEHIPGITLRFHSAGADLPEAVAGADYLLTWEYRSAWYARCPKLKAVLTPAAGGDWVAPDPDGRVERVHGTFHGRLLGESLLAAVLFMNRRMPAMIENFRRREWDRNIQRDCRLLAGQTVVILGFGHIGLECARLLLPLGPRIIGIKRDPSRLPGGLTALPGDVEMRSTDVLDETLPEADHLVVILPGVTGTDRILDAQRLARCKPGACLYNFGRGNAIASEDIAAASGRLGGVFLDVTDTEPLDPGSPLWALDNIMITPHSSCIYREYKQRFVDEVIGHLSRRIAP